MSTAYAPIRVLVAGAGAFGREHFDRLAARSDVRVVGVADTNPAALELIRSRHGALNCLTDPSRLIDGVEADAIIIATPAVSHVEICVRALGRSLCALLEKPVAPSAAAAAPLLQSARSSGGFILPGHVLRFSQNHVRLIEIVRSGRIGEVIYVNSRRYRDDNHAVRYADIDPVLMTLIHDIDLAQWVTGSDFRSVLARRSGDASYGSMTAVGATTATGVTCDLRTAWTFAGGDLPPDRLEVVGDRGSVELIVGQALHVYAEGRRTDYAMAAADDPLRNNRIIFSLVSATGRERERSICQTHSPD
jgi:predicted dehydrogenase